MNTTSHLLSPSLEAAGESHQGMKRRENEDSWLILPLGEQAALFVVADGLGGHADGKAASELGVNTVKSQAQVEWAELEAADAAAIARALVRWIERANIAVLQEAIARHNNMGSTITAALVVGRRAYIANLGDSRTYLWRGGQLTQITNDHSVVGTLVAANLLDEDEIYTHPQRNQILRSLGAEAEVEVDVFQETLAEGEALLLCSDGLWEMVRKPQMEATLRQGGNAETIGKNLIDLANRNGGDDNITVVFVRVLD